MCETCSSGDDMLLLNEAGTFVDSVLEDCLALPVSKAIDLGTRKGFDRAAALLSARLRQATGPADAKAVRDAIAVLDVDWRATTAEQRRLLIAQSMAAAMKATKELPNAIGIQFSRSAQSVVAATRADTRRRQGLAVSADFNALDHRIVGHVVRSQGNFVRDEYGRRIEDFGAQARGIVADGLSQGLGRDAISESLQQAASRVFINRAPAYWDVVASAFIGQGRSFAQMSSYAEAGITTYVVEAILDEVTTPICRFLHGKTFSVKDALARFEQVEQLENPEDIKRVLPWVRQGVDTESGWSVLYVNGTDGRVPVAEVSSSGVGCRDDRGEFRAMSSDSVLAGAGIGFPPYHGLCRTTTLAT